MANMAALLHQSPPSSRAVGSDVHHGWALNLPASIAVTYWDGRDFVPVRDMAIS
jgi:hypothetical protein